MNKISPSRGNWEFLPLVVAVQREREVIGHSWDNFLDGGDCACSCGARGVEVGEVGAGLESSVERLVGWGGSEKKSRKSLAIFL